MKKTGLLFITLMFVISGFVLWQGCSSSGSNNEESTDTYKTITDLSEVPNIDLSYIDNASNNIAAPIENMVMPKAVGDDSGVGCFSQNMYRPSAMAVSKSLQVPMCYISAAQAGLGEDVFSVPTGGTDVNTASSWAYYSVGGVKVRIGNFVSNNQNVLKGDVCEDLGSGMEHKASFDISGNTTSKTWSFGGIDRLVYDSRIFAAANVSIVMNNAANMDEAFSFDNVASVGSTGYLGTVASTEDVEDSTTYESVNIISFELNTSDVNIINAGLYDFTDSTGMQFISYYDGSEGAAYLSSQGMELSGSFNTDDITEADENAYQSIVEGATLIDVPTAAVINTNVAFTRSWDCTDENGGTDGFTAFTAGSDGLSADAFSSCETLATSVESLFDELGSAGAECVSLLGGGGGGGGIGALACTETSSTFRSSACNLIYTGFGLNTEEYDIYCIDVSTLTEEVSGNYCLVECSSDSSMCDDVTAAISVTTACFDYGEHSYCMPQQ